MPVLAEGCVVLTGTALRMRIAEAGEQFRFLSSTWSAEVVKAFAEKLAQRMAKRVATAWEPTPWWNVRRYLGNVCLNCGQMRRLHYDVYSLGREYDGVYEYATHEDCARIILEETYGRS